MECRTYRSGTNTDPVFRRTVDLLHTIIRSAELSPAEVRQAAGLAAIHYEMYRTVTFDVEFTRETRGFTPAEAEALMRSVYTPTRRLHRIGGE